MAISFISALPCMHWPESISARFLMHPLILQVSIPARFLIHPIMLEGVASQLCIMPSRRAHHSRI